MSSAESRSRAIRPLIPEFVSPFEPGNVEPGKVSVSKSPQSRLPTMLLRRNRRKIGAYLIDLRVLIVNREEDRDVATAALAEAGFTVNPPLSPASPGEELLRLDVTAIGAWGNVLRFYMAFDPPRYGLIAAVYDIDRKVLGAVADDLVPGLTRALGLMGLEVRSASWDHVPSALLEKLDQNEVLWGKNPDDAPLFPEFDRGPSISRTLTPEAAALVPAEVAAAVGELFAVPIKDPYVFQDEPRPQGIPDDWQPPPGGFWSHRHGILDGWSIPKLLAWAITHPVALPEDWRSHWRKALELSPSHAPSLTALSLHDAHPDWWASLPLGDIRKDLTGVWLLGHSDKMPAWMHDDISGAEEDRMGAAVSTIIAAVGDVGWIEEVSRVPQDCAICGRSFEPDKLAAGHVAQLRTAKACHLCVRIGIGAPSELSSPVLEEGAAAAIRELVRYAGRIVTPTMATELARELDIDPIAMILLRHALPKSGGRGQAEWLARAGVLGDRWRPSRGYISVAADGHTCRSLFERIVDDYFTANGIAHEAEPAYPYDEELNETGLRADWLLSDGRYVEAAGMMSTAAYAEKMGRKRELASRHGITLVVLVEDDLSRLHEIFA